MSDTRAGLIKVAALALQKLYGHDALSAAGDQWIAGAEIRRIYTETLRDDAEGGPQSCTRIELKDGTIVRTLAPIEGEGGLLEIAETAQAAAATAQFQPLVDELEERNEP